MNAPVRSLPRVLFVHNGDALDAHIQRLIKAGLSVSQIDPDAALATAARLQPDIVVLDSECDSGLTKQLKADAATQHILVIALVELIRPS